MAALRLLAKTAVGTLLAEQVDDLAEQAEAEDREQGPRSRGSAAGSAAGEPPPIMTSADPMTASERALSPRGGGLALAWRWSGARLPWTTSADVAVDGEADDGDRKDGRRVDRARAHQPTDRLGADDRRRGDQQDRVGEPRHHSSRRWKP